MYLKNWCIGYKGSTNQVFLQGEVYESKGFEDGANVRTSELQKITKCSAGEDTCLLAHTKNSTYELRKEDVDVICELYTPFLYQTLLLSVSECE